MRNNILIAKIFLLGSLLLSLLSYADDFEIKAFYSKDTPLFPIEIEPKERFQKTVYTGKKFTSPRECLVEAMNPEIHAYVMGIGTRIEATDVILKCVRYWTDSSCDSKYPGCLNSEDLGTPIHLSIYKGGKKIPLYLRLDHNKYSVIQTTMLVEDDQTPGKVNVGTIHQKLYEPENFSLLSGSHLSCHQVITHQKLAEAFKSIYFKDARTKAFKLNCFSIDSEGVVKHDGEKYIKR